MNLKKSHKNEQENLEALKIIILMLSYQIRMHIRNILGIINIIDRLISNSKSELYKLISYLKESTLQLNSLTGDLSIFVFDMIHGTNHSVLTN